MNLKCTVVVPAHNSEKYLEETIISILNQSMPVWQLIIIDDHSSDATLRIAQSFSHKYAFIQCYPNLRNCGVSFSRNKGVELATGDWILFMDADDIAEPNLLECEYYRLCELQENDNEDWVLVHSSYSLIGPDGEILPGVLRWRQVGREETLGYQIIRNHIISTSGVLINRQLFLSLGGFNVDLCHSEDADLWLRLAQCGGFGYVDKPLVRVRRHNNNTSKKISTMLKSEKRILQCYPLSLIEDAIHRRHLPWEVNQADYISVLYRLDYWDKGYELVRNLLFHNPEMGIAHFLCGLYFLKVELWSKAEAEFNVCLKIIPHHAASMNNLGALLAMKGDMTNAKMLLTKALKFSPNYLDALHNINQLDKHSIPLLKDLRFTWRELREVLLPYNE